MMECVVCYCEYDNDIVTCDKCKTSICDGCMLHYMKSDAEMVCVNPDCKERYKLKLLLKQEFSEFRQKILEQEFQSFVPNFEENRNYFELAICIYLNKNYEDKQRDEIANILIENNILTLFRPHINVVGFYNINHIFNAYNIHVNSNVLPIDAAIIYNNDAIYIFPCDKHDCYGKVNGVDMTCNMCFAKYCIKCHENIEGHPQKCNADKVASAKVIMETTHPCPKCATRIHKISGCSQMFCTNCKVVYDDRTMEIVTHGHIHNPHALEYRRSLMRNVANNTERIRLTSLDFIHMYYDSIKCNAEKILLLKKVPNAKYSTIARYFYLYHTSLNKLVYGQFKVPVIFVEESYREKIKHASIMALCCITYLRILITKMVEFIDAINRDAQDARKLEKMSVLYYFGLSNEYKEAFLLSSTNISLEFLDEIIEDVRNIAENYVELKCVKIFELTKNIVAKLISYSKNMRTQKKLISACDFNELTKNYLNSVLDKVSK